MGRRIDSFSIRILSQALIVMCMSVCGAHVVIAQDNALAARNARRDDITYEFNCAVNDVIDEVTLGRAGEALDAHRRAIYTLNFAQTVFSRTEMDEMFNTLEGLLKEIEDIPPETVRIECEAPLRRSRDRELRRQAIHNLERKAFTLASRSDIAEASRVYEQILELDHDRYRNAKRALFGSHLAVLLVLASRIRFRCRKLENEMTGIQ